MVIRRKGSQYQVQSKTGKVLGTHPTKAAAARQLRAIETNKHRAGRG